MKQLCLAARGFLPKRGAVTRKAESRGEMNTVAPLLRRAGLFERCCPKGGRGRRPAALSVMLPIYFVPHGLGDSAPALEEALHDSPLSRQFASLDAFEDSCLDEATMLNYGHRLVDDAHLCVLPPMLNLGGSCSDLFSRSWRLAVGLFGS